MWKRQSLIFAFLLTLCTNGPAKAQFHIGKLEQKSSRTTQGFTVCKETDPRLPRIAIDTGAVSEAILNIIDNAIKYSRDAKYLKVSTGRDGRSARVEIEDHGIGNMRNKAWEVC